MHLLWVFLDISCNPAPTSEKHYLTLQSPPSASKAVIFGCRCQGLTPRGSSPSRVLEGPSKLGALPEALKIIFIE